MKKLSYLSALLLTALFVSCTECPPQTDSLAAYFDQDGRDDVISGGVKMIPIETPSGAFKVWTKRIGNNPDIKVLLLHGGPGGTHEYLEAFDSYFPGAGIEYYYYDQLGSYYSDQPNDTSLWNLDRFVEEVEQVRKALGLNKDNFYLLGQSWGGILAIDYALKYQEHIKGLVISNMMCSAPDYMAYAQEVLGPGLGEDIFGKIQHFESSGAYDDPEYISLIEEHHYPKHVLRKPLAEWPEPVLRMFSHLNPEVYVRMQGPSEFGMAGDATLKSWDRSGDLVNITVPTLTIGAEYDTMDPDHMEWMSKQFPNGSYVYCPNGSHLTMYDDPEPYFEGLIEWIRKVDRDQM